MFARPLVRCFRSRGHLHALLSLSLAGCGSLLTPTLVAAEIPGSFRPIPLQGGGWVTGMAVRNIQSNGYSVYYARTDVGGMYRRYSNENAWKFLSGDMTSSLALNVQGIAIGKSAYTIFKAVGSPPSGGQEIDPGVGVWKSNNGGDTWFKVLSDVPFSGNGEQRLGGECIVVKPGSDPETVWVGSQGKGLWRSTTGGNAGSWTEVASTVFNSASYKLNFSSIYIAPNRTDEIWAGGNTGLFVSNNDGSNWTRILLLGLDGSSQPKVFKVWRITRLIDGTVVLGVSHEYNTATTRTNYLYKVTLKAAPSAAGWKDPANYVYTDITAQYTGNSLPSQSSITGLEVLATTNPAAPGVAPEFAGQLLVQAVQAKPRVANTTTTPWTWQTIPAVRAPEDVSPWPAWAPNDGLAPLNKITQDPFDANRWYANQGFGVSTSKRLGATPTGTHWTSFLDGIGEVVAQPPTFDAKDPRRVYLPAGDHGAATIIDGGLKPDGTPNSTPHAMISGYYAWPDNHAFSYRVLQDNAGKIYVFGGIFNNSTDGTDSPNGRLWTSTNQGTEWNLEIPYIVDDHSGFPIVPSRSTVTGIALGPVGSPPTSLVSGTFMDAIATSPDMSSYVLASTGRLNRTGIGQGGIYYTTNGKDGAGTRFTQAVLPGPVSFPANDNGVGNEWVSGVQFEQDSANPNSIFLAYNWVGFGGSSGAGLYRSTGDANNPTGKVWVKLTHPSQTVAGSPPTYGWSGNPFRLAVDSHPDSSGTAGVPRLWVAGVNVTIGLKYSNDRGVTWNKLSDFTAAKDVSAREGVICVVGQRTGDTYYKIYLSQDNGATWDEVTRANYRFPKTEIAVLSPHVPGQVWVVGSGTSYSIFTPDTTVRNLLANPSFESDLTGWGYNSNQVTTVQTGGVFGSKVARLGPATVNGGLTRTVTLPSPLPAKIKLSFWAQPSASYGYNLGASITLKNASGATLTTQSVNVGNSTAWKKYETPVIDLSAYPTANRVEILFWKPVAPTGSSVDIDHVQLVRVPTFVPTFSQ
ncbi:MAG: hypothetical protein H7067_07520 [Burkholderiales bacterium]|nr:hypothetical protein [Opitutaceae bacterium]